MAELAELLLVPSSLVALFAIAAGAAALAHKHQQLSRFLFFASASVYLVFATAATPQWMMGNLEREFPPSEDAVPPASVQVAVVLAGYGRVNIARPVSGQLNDASAFRCMEAVRLANRHRTLTLLISGAGQVPELMRQMMIQLGVPPDRIETDVDSVNTYESAVHLRDRLGGRPFLLVTSAGHMPRAMRVFRRQGLEPIPAPTHYLAPSAPLGANLVPSARSLAISDLAVHEFLAMLWYRLLDRI